MRFAAVDEDGCILKEFNSSDVKKAKAHVRHVYQDRKVEVRDISNQLTLFPNGTKSIIYDVHGVR